MLTCIDTFYFSVHVDTFSSQVTMPVHEKFYFAGNVQCVTLMFWGYVQCAAHESDTRVRTNTNQKQKSKILEKGETIRSGETFPREQWPVCVQSWRKWWIQADQFLSIPLLKGTAMHIYINGDNWLLWILSTIRSKTKIISSRRVAYCRHSTAALHFPRNETLQHRVSNIMSPDADHWGNTQYSPRLFPRLFLAFVSCLKFPKPNESIGSR